MTAIYDDPMRESRRVCSCYFEAHAIIRGALAGTGALDEEVMEPFLAALEQAFARSLADTGVDYEGKYQAELDAQDEKFVKEVREWSRQRDLIEGMPVYSAPLTEYGVEVLSMTPEVARQAREETTGICDAMRGSSCDDHACWGPCGKCGAHVHENAAGRFCPNCGSV